MNLNLLVNTVVTLLAFLGLFYVSHVLPKRRRTERRAFEKELHAEKPWTLIKLVEDCKSTLRTCRFDFNQRYNSSKCACSHGIGILICLTHNSPHGGPAHCIVDYPSAKCTYGHDVGSYVLFWQMPEITKEDIGIDLGVRGWRGKLSMPVPDTDARGPWPVHVILNGRRTRVSATWSKRHSNALTIRRIKVAV